MSEPAKAPFSSPSEIRYALGSALMLLAGVAAAIACAFLLRMTYRGTYITFVMPAFAGWLVGAAVGSVGRRFAPTERTPAILAAVLGALIAFVGYQVLAYLDAVQFLVAKLATPVDHLAAHPMDAVLAMLERETGRDGYFAYLGFVASEHGAALSPLGLLAKGGLGFGVTVALIVGEGALCVGASVLSTRRRLPSRAVDADSRREVIIARTDEAGLIALMRRVDAGAWEEAGRGLAARPEAATHAVLFDYEVVGGAPYALRIHPVGADESLGAAVAERRVPAPRARALWDALRAARGEAA